MCCPRSFNKVLRWSIFVKQNLRFELVGSDTEIWLSRKAKSTKLGDHKDQVFTTCSSYKLNIQRPTLYAYPILRSFQKSTFVNTQVSTYLSMYAGKYNCLLNVTLDKTLCLLYICVSCWLLAHESRDLSQAKTKITLVKS